MDAPSQRRLPAEEAFEQPALKKRELSLATISLISVILFGALSLGVAVGLLAASTAVWRAAQRAERAVETLALTNSLDRRVRDHFRLSSIWVATREPAVDVRRGEIETEVDRLLEQILARATTPEEVHELTRLSDHVGAYLTEREALEASGLPLEEIVRGSRSAFDPVLETISSLREADKRDLLETRRDASRMLRFQYALVIAIVCVLGAGLVTVTLGFRRLVLRPLHRLQDLVRRFRDGDSEARATEGPPYEMRTLAAAFNDMVDTINTQRRDQLTFLAAVAHDLRNPLAALKMLVQSLEREPTVASPDRFRRLAAQLDRLNRLVGDLLDATKIEAGQLELEREVFDLRDTARAVLDLYAPTTTRHELLLRVSDEPVLVCADPLRIEQVTSNLLNNAIKFSPGGGRIEVSVEAEQGRAELSVSDQGVGIRSEHVADVFQPFRRGATTAPAIPGVGLGLSIVRHIVTAHRGDIDVESEPDRARPFACHSRFARRARSRIVTSPMARPPEPNGRASVLIVDDDPDVPEILADILIGEGLRVRIASDGLQGLRMLHEELPDAVILDVEMPHLTGPEMARRMILHDAGMERVPVVLVSGIVGLPEVARQLGAPYFLSKPFDLDDLLAALHSALEDRRPLAPLS